MCRVYVSESDSAQGEYCSYASFPFRFIPLYSTPLYTSPYDILIYYLLQTLLDKTSTDDQLIAALQVLAQY